MKGFFNQLFLQTRNKFSSKILSEVAPIKSSDPNALNFRDGKALYSKFGTEELINQLKILETISSTAFAQFAPSLFKLCVLSNLQDTIYKIIKPNIFAHFCAGETIQEAAQSFQEYQKKTGLNTILFLSTENASATSEWYDEVAQKVIDFITDGSKAGLNFSAFKIGGLVNHSLLRKLNVIVANENFIQNIHQHAEDPTRITNEYLHSLFVCDQSFSKSDKNELEKLISRIDSIFQASKELNVRQLVDAEQTYFQDAIDFFTLFFMLKYNKESSVVWGTYQMYRKDTMDRLRTHGKISEQLDIHFAFKMVRGAYMNEENALALKEGRESPIHDTLQNTHDAYNTSARIMIDLAASNEKISFMIASHNEETQMLATSHIRTNNLNHSRVYFAQLKGMAEHLSITLGKNGFNTCKLMPFGKIEEVIPYIFRRLEENKGMFGNTYVERSLIRDELLRRKMETQKIE